MADQKTPKSDIPVRAATTTTSAKSLADDRTVLANERTYAAWLRTGIAALVAGLAVEKLQGDLMPFWAVNGIAAALVTFSAVSFILGTWRYYRMEQKLQGLTTHPLPTAVILVISAMLAMAAALGAVAVFWFSPWMRTDL